MPRLPHRPRLLATVCAFAFAVAGAMVGSPAARAQTAPPPPPAAGLSAVDIHWDQFGVPHIVADDLVSAVRGYGYAQMQAHAEMLLTLTARARGSSAALFGAGLGNANVGNDTYVLTAGIPRRSVTWLAQSSPRQRAIIDAYVAGANEFAATAGANISPALAQVLPLVPADVMNLIQLGIHFTFLPENVGTSGLIAAWQRGQLPARAPTDDVNGSNAFAIAPERSQTGNALLVGNPHLPYGAALPVTGAEVFHWFEAHMIFGEENVYGASLPGAPFIGIGFNDKLGWTHTNNTIKNADLYEIVLAPNGYVLDGQVRPFGVRQETLRIRQPNGTVATQPLTVLETVHGPLVAQRNDGRALALRVAGLDQPGIIDQYWDMITADNITQFRSAQERLQMPFFNVMYADRDGRIMYIFGGRQPRRNGGTFDDYATIIRGDISSTLWTDTLTFAELPQTIDPPSGVLHNCNDPPWTSTFPQTIRFENFPAYISNQEMFPRAQQCAKVLQTELRYTLDEAIDAKMSTRFEIADRVLPDLVTAALASRDELVREAARVLIAWDRQSEADSVGAELFARWIRRLSADPASADGDWSGYPDFRFEWSPNLPTSTPVGLADRDAAVAALRAAAEDMLRTYGTLQVPWGEANRLILFGRDANFAPGLPRANEPLNGADGYFGTLRVSSTTALPGTPLKFSAGGDSYVPAIEFTPTGPNARASITYGNSTRPGTANLTDQLRFFTTQSLRPVNFTAGQATAAAVRTERLPAR